MAVEDRQIFRDHYNQLLYDSKEVALSPQDALTKIEQTFEALASLGSAAPKNLQIAGCQIPVNNLQGEDINLFVSFAKKILRKADIPEAEAEKMRENVVTIREHGLQELTWAPPPNRGYNMRLQRMAGHKIPDREELNGGLGRSLESIDKEITLYTRFEASAENAAVNLISKDLTMLQDHAKEVNKSERKEQRRALIIKTITTAVIAGSVLAAGYALMFAFPPIGIGVMIATALIIGITLMGGFRSMYPNVKNLLERNFPHYEGALKRIHEVKAYKMSLQEPAFAQFAADPQNKYDELSVKKETLYKLLDIYALQKKYTLKLKLASAALLASAGKPTANPLALAQFQKLNGELAQINSLRQELKLDPLANPDF